MAWGEPAWRAASLRRASSARRSVMGCSDIAPEATWRGRRSRRRQTAVVDRGRRRTDRAVEPAPSRWAFPADPAVLAAAASEGEVVAVGADLEPGTLLAA